MTLDNVPNMKETKVKVDYLKELLIDRTVLSNYPNVFLHVSKILEKEILRTRSALLSIYGIYSIADSELPEPSGPKVNLHCKVYMPTEANSSFNFVGRILGPDGSTAKCLQQCLGVKIMVRGRGSMRDRKKEEANIGRPNWEHLSDKLHVVLTVDDFESRAQARLAKASDYITLFLKECTKGSDREDKVKQMQLMELSFQRDLRSSWSLDCHNLMDLGKAGSLYPGPANLLNFAYQAAYPAAPLFSAFHDATQQHHGSPPGFHARHYYSSPVTGSQQTGQQTQPTGQHHHQSQQQHTQGHFTSVPSSHGSQMTNASGTGTLHNNQQMAAAAAAAMSVGGLAFPSSTNLGSAALLFGPANAQGHHHHHHTGTYSPPIGTGGQVTGTAGTTLPPGTVAVAPMSYWQAGPSAGPHALSQMTAAAGLDYRHLQQHPHHQSQQQQHHIHQVAQEHLQQAAGYPIPGAPYATTAQLHPLGFSGELIQPILSQEYPLCSRDGQSMESTVAVSAEAVVAAATSSLGTDARCSEAGSVATHPASTAENAGGAGALSSVPLESTGAGDATKSGSAAVDKSAKVATGSATSGFTVSAKGSVGGANQTPVKYPSGIAGTGTKKRYLQNHHSQFITGSGSSKSGQQHAPLSTPNTSQQQQKQQQQQQPTSARPGRSEIVTVRVPPSGQQSNHPVKSVHGSISRETGNKSGYITSAKRSSQAGSNEPAGVKPESYPSACPSSPASLGKETRTGAISRSPLSNTTVVATASTAKKSTVTASIVSVNDSDWPQVGTEVKMNNAVADSQVTQGLMHLSIGNTSSKAI